MLLTPSGMQLVTDAIEPHDPEQLARRYFFAMDLVLGEGFSHAACAKIEVLRAACSPVARCTVADGLIAMVTDVAVGNPQLPLFVPDDIAGIARFVLDWQSQQGAAA